MKIFHIELSGFPDNPGYAFRHWNRRPEEFKEASDEEIAIEANRLTKDWFVTMEAILEPVRALGLAFENPKEGDYYFRPKPICTGEQLIELMAMGLKPEVISTSELGANDGAFHKFQQLIERMERVGEVWRNGEPPQFNEVCNVHMPGQALAMYNETMLVTDSCTDVVQGHLDAGWRIIAACPQPDQRRPDYIMGRYNPDRNVDALGRGALRG